jgi:NAD(P)-dependent dehydrogenase (short-subunit alcohol dehydrogenase family)
MTTALVTGANRGIGLAGATALAAEGLDVVLTARAAGDAERAARDLGGGVRAEQLDVADPGSVRACAERLAADGVEVDVLVNNAGILLDSDGPLLGGGGPPLPEDVWMANLQVHFLGAIRTCQAWVPGMVRRGYGRVVNVASGWGSIADGVPGPAGYALGKAGLRAVTRKVAAEVRGDVKVNCMDPGWVATRMGPGASRTPEQAADTLVWLATLPADGISDRYVYDRRTYDW